MNWTPSRDCRMSPDRRYRYYLRIRWTDAALIMFIGLNPSTADEKKDDPTMRRLIDFAKRWGFGGLMMTNLFAYRATDPKTMILSQDPVGSENTIDDLARYRSQCKRAVACWGQYGSCMARGRAVILALPELEAFGWTSNGQPVHPLYLKKSATPAPIDPQRLPPETR